MVYRVWVFTVLALFVAAVGGCSKREAVVQNTNGAASRAIPGKTYTATDIAKLKWLEGTWRGMDGDKPFFERYRFDGTTMIVEALSANDPSKIEDTSRFELKDGEFAIESDGQRSAATEITDDHVQFVPVVGRGNNFRFARQTDGTWQAVLEWTAVDNTPKRKIYRMEPYK
jgi:hypothetical protein